jgi:hypothetical protein
MCSAKGKPNSSPQFVVGRFIALGNLEDLFDRIEIQSLQAFAHGRFFECGPPGRSGSLLRVMTPGVAGRVLRPVLYANNYGRICFKRSLANARLLHQDEIVKRENDKGAPVAKKPPAPALWASAGSARPSVRRMPTAAWASQILRRRGHKGPWMGRSEIIRERIYIKGFREPFQGFFLTNRSS